MIKYTASYLNGAFNFVIQNLDRSPDESDPYLPIIYILKNLLQRGKPARFSRFLEKSFPNVKQVPKSEDSVYLISDGIPQWTSTIKGETGTGKNPAKDFFYNKIPQYLNHASTIQNLLLPEVLITDIIHTEYEGFINQRVDFYLPQARLVIEIDGGQHREEANQLLDNERVEILNSHGIEVVRISTDDLGNSDVEIKFQQIRRRLNLFSKKLLPYIHSMNQEGIIEDLKAIAVMRWQLTILSLLESGELSLTSNKWSFEVIDHEGTEALQLAIDDLMLWLKHLSKLKKLPFDPPEVFIDYVEDFGASQVIRINFSLKKRWTDEDKIKPDIIFVRSDYLDDHDYFTMATTDPINYEIIEEGKESDYGSLLFLLQNLFGFEEFANGQLQIIINSLRGRDTVGLLPTGGGKSLCYQYAAMLQPSISFSVVPIKSLMYDQIDNLRNNFFFRTNYISSDQTPEEKQQVQREFSQGKYWFILISPERFQTKDFRHYLDELNRNKTIALAVIDEVHCLSEWGHDFRTSYLQLPKTIQNYCPSTRFLGLTATASLNVLEDILKEFGIGKEDVRTLYEYTRPELTFNVFNVNGDKRKKRAELLQLLEVFHSKSNVFELNEKETKSGLIFTINAGGNEGCVKISTDISRRFKKDVRWYSGELPKKVVMTKDQHQEYKKKVQTDYKDNKFPLLVSTKAFGMGIDKPNIRYTIHYGIPGSLESLYQEAGRAGRDKQPAACYVLFNKDKMKEEELNSLFELNTSMEEIKKIVDAYGFAGGDILGNFFLWKSNWQGVKEETELAFKLLKRYGKPQSAQIVKCRDMDSSFVSVQRAIYRLSVLGFINDWIVTGWNQNGTFEVDFADYDEEKTLKSLLGYILKYDDKFSLDEGDNLARNQVYISIFNDITKEFYEKLLQILIQWSYDNIFYNRRTSLKTLVDLCENFPGKEEFKRTIENYFRFTEAGYILDHIVHNSDDYHRWFEVFLTEEHEDFINRKELLEIRAALVRFLETYRFNTGLNFISGMVRLFLDDFSNLDGRARLNSAFEAISQMGDKKLEILNLTLSLGKRLDERNKELLSEVLCGFFPDQLADIYEELGDNYSLLEHLLQSKKKVIEIGDKIYG